MIMPFHLAGMSLPISPKLPGLLHIPADHEHQFRFNVNTISGPM